MEYKGEIKGFPQEVVEKMLDYQEEQGNKRNIKVFEECKYNGVDDNGFTWNKTKDGEPFWGDVLIKKDFDVFFKKYPKPEYIYKDKPYKIVCESKIKLKGILYLIALVFPSKLSKDLIKEYGGWWVDVVIYECLYENPDGKIWVREKKEFYDKFRKA